MQGWRNQVEGKNWCGIKWENQAHATMTKRKGKFGKFGPQKEKKNMAKVRCYGCQEYGHYKRDCPKLKKDNNKRGREEAHITEEVEEAEKKKSKKEEVKDLYYNWDILPHLVLFKFLFFKIFLL